MHVSVKCQCALRQNAGFRFGLVPDVETPMRHFTLPQYIHSLQSLVIRVYVLFLSFGKYFINATCWLMYRDNRLTTPPQACETGSGWAAAVTHCQHSSGCGSRLWRHDNKPDLTLRISRLEKKKVEEVCENHYSKSENQLCKITARIVYHLSSSKLALSHHFP